MGMMEERKDWAANRASHAKRMFEQTSNPYYLIEALAATSIGDFLPPDWALALLLKGVERAWVQANIDGDEISLDKALGLRTKRGGSPPRRSAKRLSAEDAVFHLVKNIHACFDLSIPDACEIVYHSVDKEFAEGMDEVLWKPKRHSKFSDEDLNRLGITREKYDEIEESEKNISRKIVESDSSPDAVKEKLRLFDWWNVFRGERLGYGLDQLIDRYYRVGSKRVFPHGKVSEKLMLFFEGSRLLDHPELCATKVRPSARPGERYVSESALTHLGMRSDFHAFHKKFNIKNR